MKTTLNIDLRVKDPLGINAAARAARLLITKGHGQLRYFKELKDDGKWLSSNLSFADENEAFAEVTRGETIRTLLQHIADSMPEKDWTRVRGLYWAKKSNRFGTYEQLS